MKELPVGISDYKEVIDENYYYVDKTFFVKEIMENGGKVALIPRPRRFGKTINLSMLRYFFEKTEADTSYLFQDKYIWQEEKYKAMQGKYPVIFITFKGIKEDRWEPAYERIAAIIAAEFARHQYLFDTLEPWNKKKFVAILNQESSEAMLRDSLFFLTQLLQTHYNQRVMVFIDEYDAPVQTAYLNGYYEQMIDLMRAILNAVYKDNSFLERGVLTGILRTAKEGIFSGLNNLNVCPLNGIFFTTTFGLTDAEVKLLLKDQKLASIFEDVRAWYDGYTFGQTKVYNPWSVIQCAYQRGLFKSYWLNTSDNTLIKRLMARGGVDLKKELELLLDDQPMIKEIDEGIVFPGIEKHNRAIWSLMLYSGYVTYSQQELIEGITYCTLKIPNKEIKILYKSLIQEIFESSLESEKTILILQALTTGEIQLFQDLLQEFIINSMSTFDLNADEPEKSYHLFILGLLVLLSDTYEVKSNRESGLGRYDIMLIPRKAQKLGIIIEFKKVWPYRNETLEEAADAALKQIQERHYAQELKSRGIADILFLGIAFQGKKVLVKDAR